MSPSSSQLRMPRLDGAGVDEHLRLAALQSYDILDTPREEAFDRIVRLIRNVFDVPIAFISMIAADRQWAKACIGLPDPNLDRKVTFCRMVLASGQPVVIEDLSQAEDWKNSPFVTGPAHMRFYAGVPLRTMDGFVLGTLCAIDKKPRSFTEANLDVLTDLAAIVMHELELRRTAEVDVLTKVLTRRAFTVQARQVLALMDRQDRFSSVIMLDIDRFKAVNDTHGHATGDLVLSEVARICQTQLRSTDLVGRLGGEEFVVLLPGTGAKDAVRIAEKIRKAIAAAAIDVGSTSLAVTSSFGIATVDAKTSELNALLGLADAGLYMAKSRGRDRVVALQAEMQAERQTEG
ncbi:sensor domain-containing diguanylate cyclase [Tianweitania sp. BSSL-BM11]|uniref:diguanylate cyclase n=1 Tax=Tianweitania aestuarii TaxID=2814886 RepID=A0ABS5RQI9_9HYPH|nr:sensor domain-containing diguanylate cyclase [Tianweitania aestuarii]MBS9719308.1 sensor domain-containing diguanylate cyclase [Tianweitania aestuarii]